MKNERAQFGIVQGGLDPKLRQISAEQIVEIGFDGYAIGGLSVGETRQEMIEPMQISADALPKQQPRYFMGLGDPAGLVEAIACGVDMFDCVWPTRLARHGTALTMQGALIWEQLDMQKAMMPLTLTSIQVLQVGGHVVTYGIYYLLVNQ